MAARRDLHGGRSGRRELRSAGWPVRMAVLGTIWGFSFLFIKVGDEALSPLQVAFGRVLCGAVTLVVFQVASRAHLPRRGVVWMHLAVVAFLLNALPYTLFAYGERHVTSVIAGIWNATTALFTLPIAVLMLPMERADVRRVGGVIIGFVGVVVVFGVWSTTLSGSLAGNLACMAAAICYGLGISYTRRFLSESGESSLSLATGQLLVAGVQLAVVTGVATSVPSRLPIRVVSSVLALGALGTGIAFVISYSLVRDIGAARSSTVTYLITVVATLAGVIFLHEHLTWNQPLGAAVILAGAALANSRSSGLRTEVTR